MQSNKRMNVTRLPVRVGEMYSMSEASSAPFSERGSCLRGPGAAAFQLYLGELETLFRVGGIVHQAAAGRFLVSGGARSILGFSVQTELVEDKQLIARIHQVDRKRVRNALTGKSHVEQGERLSFRLLAPDGIVRWCRAIAVGQLSTADVLSGVAFMLIWLGEYRLDKQSMTRAVPSPGINSDLVNAVADYLRRISPELAEARKEEISQLVSESCGRMLPIGSLPAICQTKLTFRELEICAAVASGKSTKQIATDLFISPESVRTARKNIRRKLGLRLHRQHLYSFLTSV